MASMPRKLKNMNLFVDGVAFLGQVAKVTLPPLTRKTEDYRGGGMDAPVKTDMGMEGLVIEWGGGGWMPEILAKFGDPQIGGTQLRWMGAVQRDDTGQVDAVEVVTRGRFNEIGRGESAPGEDTEQTHKTDLVFYAEYWNGREVYYFDILNMIARVNGVDRLAKQRKAIGA